jgi:hypothetical protein
MSLLTLDELSRLLGVPAVNDADLACMLGLMLPRLVERHPLGTRDVAWHIDEIVRARDEGRIALYFDAYGRLAGTLFWKRLDDEAEAALLAGGDPVELAASASGTPWIAHLDAHKVELSCLLRRAAADGPLASMADIAYARIRRGWRIAKQVRLPSRWQAGRGAPTPGNGFLASGGGGQMRGEAQDMLAEARRLGEWLLVSRNCAAHAQRRPAALLDALVMPLRLGHYLETRAPDGRLEAFMTYGLLTDEGLDRFRHHGATALSPACFSEGDVLTALCAGATRSPDAEATLVDRVATLHPGLRRDLRDAGLAALAPA